MFVEENATRHCGTQTRQYTHESPPEAACLLLHGANRLDDPNDTDVPGHQRIADHDR